MFPLLLVPQSFQDRSKIEIFNENLKKYLKSKSDRFYSKEHEGTSLTLDYHPEALGTAEGRKTE